MSQLRTCTRGLDGIDRELIVMGFQMIFDPRVRELQGTRVSSIEELKILLPEDENYWAVQLSNRLDGFDIYGRLLKKSARIEPIYAGYGCRNCEGIFVGRPNILNQGRDSWDSGPYEVWCGECNAALLDTITTSNSSY